MEADEALDAVSGVALVSDVVSAWSRPSTWSRTSSFFYEAVLEVPSVLLHRPPKLLRLRSSSSFLLASSSVKPAFARAMSFSLCSCATLPTVQVHSRKKSTSKPIRTPRFMLALSPWRCRFVKAAPGTHMKRLQCSVSFCVCIIHEQQPYNMCVCDIICRFLLRCVLGNMIADPI